ncbi:SGNH/GDSL hydrolase family protein [Clostridium tertium]|uniref:SGNH/GDSL hydrolase family protein n=1 Tax=Clostridium tertium TaxID=1559 RepID=UPI0024B37685|nr:SGNH/GDSL hydrolase family protein [Clostridium tertium]MDI9218334.1 SGNH/GDSL hydrolase family protein [Clostridium tertium]
MDYIITEEMIKNSLVSKGDTLRLAKVLMKAGSGQDITVAFLGGSITQGCNATKQEDCYASRTYLWFKDTFSNININFINAGVGATGSIIGVHRVQKQVLDKNPDIIFIDFAVNDKSTNYDKVAYESLIRRILSVENPPAIVEVFMSNFDGSNVQAQQIEIGGKYNIPMISFRDTVHSEIEKGNLKWQDVASDEVHPNDYGHFIISELLIDFMKNILADINKTDNTKIDKKEIDFESTVFGEKYKNGFIENNKCLEVNKIKGFIEDSEGFQVFQHGWKCSLKKGNTAFLEVDIECKDLFLLYKKSVKDSAGKIEVIVDGNNPIIIDTYFEDGWGDYSATELLVEFENISNHNIKINVLDEEKETETYIMGFLVS